MQESRHQIAIALKAVASFLWGRAWLVNACGFAGQISLAYASFYHAAHAQAEDKAGPVPV